jgi:hypothetical protein
MSTSATWSSARKTSALSKIDADEQQRESAEQIKVRLLERFDQAQLGRASVRKEFVDAFERPEPDSQRLHALLDERARIYEEAAHAVLDGALELHGVLSPEQRAEIVEMLERRWR